MSLEVGFIFLFVCPRPRHITSFPNHVRSVLKIWIYSFKGEDLMYNMMTLPHNTVLYCINEICWQ